MNNLYTQNFGTSQIVLAFTLIALAMGLSKIFRLQLENDFFWASLRTTLQLIGVGYILRWVLKNDSTTTNFAILSVMTLVAAHAITSRLKNKSFKMYFIAVCSLFGSVWLLGGFVLLVYFQSEAFHQSAFFIPFMGVVMGNTLSAISLALGGLEKVRIENIHELETFKALGASSMEACQRIYREVLRTSLTPNINAMTVVGVVSLPGVMAGQLIGGVDPLIAARFQILVMFLILLAAMTGALIGLVLNHYLFMPDWLLKKEPSWSFDLQCGDRLALTGPSGIGKSRLLKSMTGLDDIAIRIKARTQSPQLFQTVNQLRTFYLPQKPYFIPGTVAENLQWPWTFKKQQALGQYQATAIQNLFEALDVPTDLLNKNAMTLSGGEAQLIHLIRSLQFNPEVLLLDEPTSSLDPSRTARLESFLKSWSTQKNHRLVIISHHQEQIQRLCNRGLRLETEGSSLF